MVKVTLDAALLAQLGQVDTPLEICDDAGRTVGYYHPAVNRPTMTGQPIRSPFSDEEIQRRRQQRTGRPLAEILKELERS